MSKVLLWNFHVKVNRTFAGEGFVCEQHDSDDVNDKFLPRDSADDVDYIVAFLRKDIDTLGERVSAALVGEVERTLDQIARIRRRPVPVLFVASTVRPIIKRTRARALYTIRLRDGVEVTVVVYNGLQTGLNMPAVLAVGPVPTYDVQRRYPQRSTIWDSFHVMIDIVVWPIVQLWMMLVILADFCALPLKLAGFIENK